MAHNGRINFISEFGAGATIDNFYLYVVAGGYFPEKLSYQVNLSAKARLARHGAGQNLFIKSSD
jgi:hypothetical protein